MQPKPKFAKSLLAACPEVTMAGPSFLRQLLWASCLFRLFSAADVWGASLRAENYFSGEQLKAYRLAQKGKTDLVIEAAKAGVELNRPGKEDLTMLGLAVLTADRRAIVTLIRADGLRQSSCSPASRRLDSIGCTGNLKCDSSDSRSRNSCHVAGVGPAGGLT